jgi:tetrahydromethanopterin S-methyltransferase subunit A
VARFREQIEVINLLGVTDPDRILAAVRDCASRPLPAFHTASAKSTCCSDTLGAVKHIRAKAPKRLRLDPAGFFIVLPQRQKGVIVCEHYENSGRLAHVIEGRQAALIAATVVERGLVTQLDHAAYLGRELAKAEVALSIGISYEQDAALGQLATTQEWPEPHKTKESDCECAKPRLASGNETLLKPKQIEYDDEN